MTIDPETKQYINKLMIEQSVKVSSFLSSLCNMLEDKKVITREDFDILLQRSQNMASQIHSMGAGNFTEFSRNFKQLEKLAKELEKDSIEGRKNWEDLK